jgi:cytochrome c oxidase subunit 2
MLYLLIVSVVFSTGIFLALVIFAIKYRHRPGNRVARKVKTSFLLETLWSLIPFGIVLVAFFWGAHRYLDQMTPRLNAEHISVIGKQWMWKAEHENGVSEINELHVPVGLDVSLLMISQDVIHSFFIPDFRVKYDVLPGRYTRLWFKAEKPGRYFLFCAQYCGMDHARMGGWVVAQSESEYRNWLERERKRLPFSSLPENRGKQLFSTHGCVSCHGGDATLATGEKGLLSFTQEPIAPRLFGRFRRGDEEFLRESILEPNARVHPGYQALMPTYAGLLKEDEVLDLITYLTVSSAKEAKRD